MPVRALMPRILLLVFSLLPSSVYAWGKQGHEIVAIVAEERLDPEVRGEVNALLSGTTFIQASIMQLEGRFNFRHICDSGLGAVKGYRCV